MGKSVLEKNNRSDANDAVLALLVIMAAVIAGVVLWRLLGFHPLLLPTFLVEFLPMTDMLPTWTGCVALVTASAPTVDDDPPPPGPGQVIDGKVVDKRQA